MSCLNCPPTEEVLPIDTVMYNGFGGWSLHKNGKYFYSADNDLEWDKNPTLKDFEEMAKKDDSAKWTIEMNLPLRDATYERENGIWKLIKKGQGFA